MSEPFTAVLFLSFGGPERPEEVMPFLENVTRGRGVPADRLAEVAEHYHHFGGASPINGLNRDMMAALRSGLAQRGADLPVYFGNRNWDPYVEDAVETMYRDGHRRILVFTTSAWGGYSGCKQYHEDIARAVAALAERVPESTADPVLLRKLPQYWAEAAFLESQADAVRRAVAALPDPTGPFRLVFTAHSIPVRADRAIGDGLYSRQVDAACAQVAQRLTADGTLGAGRDYDQVWQSRSGPPEVPWLEPDIADHLRALADDGVEQVVVAPIGFVSDHLEVIWDLDSELAELAGELDLGYSRAATVGTDPRFTGLIADLVQRYADGGGDLDAPGCGDNGAGCRAGCCGDA
ncbi:ferrochelatase [Gordonia crocea]|uniref:Coproporphyrin III ferrochelatase n=1 Tax=Gordonia crocea TaxID=589162 RepID=A0A7I9UY33_9ACTN|nr:ferrochelatase [Gordonia crocea]GED97819.1 ferrochelatase [Gordonia crocea]